MPEPGRAIRSDGLGTRRDGPTRTAAAGFGALARRRAAPGARGEADRA
ncbi:hypothetical protein QA634_16620 [Methylobacterium sp. CB376]|nr:MULTISPECIES: hypothetical protein [Methylobacterium]WFT83353.1 hypothetical protein QA634_16620 [Methylobacterium nodulans]